MQGQPRFLAVSPDFCKTYGIPLIAGREFHPADDPKTAALVNESFARTYFGDINVVGRRFEALTGSTRRETKEIAGVVADARYDSVREPAPPTAYVMHGDGGWATLAVRTHLDTPSLATVLRREFTSVSGKPVINQIQSQQRLVEGHLRA